MILDSQLAVLKADIAADPTFGPLSNTPDNGYLIAVAYSQNASPDFWIWRTDLAVTEMVNGNSAGPGIDWSEYASLSAQTQSTFLALTQSPFIDATQANIRSAFGSIFSSGGSPNSRANLLAMGRRRATRVEKLFSTGAGSTASPAITSFFGALTYSDIQRART